MTWLQAGLGAGWIVSLYVAYRFGKVVGHEEAEDQWNRRWGFWNKQMRRFLKSGVEKGGSKNVSEHAARKPGS